MLASVASVNLCRCIHNSVHATAGRGASPAPCPLHARTAAPSPARERGGEGLSVATLSGRTTEWESRRPDEAGPDLSPSHPPIQRSRGTPIDYRRTVLIQSNTALQRLLGTFHGRVPTLHPSSKTVHLTFPAPVRLGPPPPRQPQWVAR